MLSVSTVWDHSSWESTSSSHSAWHFDLLKSIISCYYHNLTLKLQILLLFMIDHQHTFCQISWFLRLCHHNMSDFSFNTDFCFRQDNVNESFEFFSFEVDKYSSDE